METFGKERACMMNETKLESCAEAELSAAIVEALQTATGGPVLGGVLVESIHSYDIAEDGRTLCVMCEMADGSTAMISVCPGRPITACVVT